MTVVPPFTNSDRTAAEVPRSSPDTGIGFSDLSRLCLTFQNLVDDYDFVSGGGRLHYLVDFNVITFCMYLRENTRLSKLLSRQRPDHEMAYAQAVWRSLHDYAGKGRARSRLGILKPHKYEFDISRYAVWKQLTRILCNLNSQREWLEHLAGKDPADLDATVIEDIVNHLQTHAPQVFSMFDDTAVNALTTREFLQKNLQVVQSKPVWEEGRAGPHAADRPPISLTDRLTEAQLTVGGKKSVTTASQDSLALLALAELNSDRNAGRRERRYVLITADTRLSCLVSFARARGSQWDGVKWSDIHVRDLNAVPLMVNFGGNACRGDMASRVREISESLSRPFREGGSLNPMTMVVAAYPMIFQEAADRSPAYLDLARALDEVLRIPPSDGSVQDLVGEARRRTEAGVVRQQVERMCKTLGVTLRSQETLVAAFNLVIARSPPADSTNAAKQRFINVLKSPNFMRELDRALQGLFSLVAKTVDPPDDPAVREYLYAAIDLKEARRDAHRLMGRMPLALRDDPEDPDRSIEALNRWLAGNSSWLDFPMGGSSLPALKRHLMTAYLRACNGNWKVAEQHCLAAHELAQAGSRPTLASEALLLLAFVKRASDNTPKGLVEAVRLLSRARAAAGHRGGTSYEALRFESEEIAQMLYLHNQRRYLPNELRWTALKLPGFEPLASLEERLTHLAEAVERPDSLGDLDGEPRIRLRTQVHLNICGCLLLQWIEDGRPLDQGLTTFLDSLGYLRKLMAGHYETRSYFARITFLFAQWLTADVQGDRQKLAASAIEEIDRALRQPGLLAVYERYKFQKYAKMMRLG